MSDIFYSSKYSIARAKHHISDLKRQVTEFIKSEPGAVFGEIDENTSEQVFKLKFIKPLPYHLPGIVADAVNNLRSALDQSIYAIAVTIGVAGWWNLFPFSSDAAHFPSRAKGCCKGFPQEIIDLIGTFKPYKGGDDRIYTLNTLSNANKHATISLISTAVTTMQVKGSLAHSASILGSSFDWTKNEMEILREPIGVTSNVEFEISYFVTIRNVEFVNNVPVSRFFDNLASIVEGIVMALEAECRRIGLI